MKKNKLFKPILLLFAVFVFSSCDDSEPIEFIVADDFEQTVSIQGLAARTTFTIDSSTDISGLLDNKEALEEAEIETVTITLNDDFSGDSIALNLDVKVGNVTLFNNNITLVKGEGIDLPLAEALDIFSLITSSNFPFSLTGTSSTPLGDDDFSIKLKFKVKAKVTT